MVKGKEKPKLKCPELEDDEFEKLREELQTFKTHLKLINTGESASVKKNAKRMSKSLCVCVCASFFR